MAEKHLSILSLSLNTGGAERVISLLLKELVKDYRVTLVLLMDDVAFHIPEEVDVKILGPSGGLANVSPVSKILKTLSFIRKYRKYLKEDMTDVSLSFLAVPNMINVLACGWLGSRRPRVIISERCYPSQMYADSRFSMLMAKILYPFLYSRSDLIISNSMHINEDLRSRFKVRAPMKVIYNPVEVEETNGFQDDFTGDGPFRLVNVGSHIGVKDQSLILKAMRRLDGNVHLSLLGSGPLTDKIREMTLELKLTDDVHMPGRVADVGKRLLNHDCFILSSVTEGFPNVLLEAMAAGLPVISTNCLSGPLEILNENQPIDIADGEFYLAKYGILVNVGDVQGLSSAINFMRTHSEKRREYSTLAHKRALEFDLKRIYRDLHQAIEHEN